MYTTFLVKILKTVIIIICEQSLKNTYGKKVQSTKYTGKRLETHFLTGTAGFEFMRDFSSCDNFSSVVPFVMEQIRDISAYLKALLFCS